MVAVQSAQTLSRHGIGASEIGAVAGLNPFASPWDIWLRKTGQAPDVEPSEPMEWGNRLEPAIRQKYCDDTRTIVHVPPTSLFSKEREWARATPDGIVVNETFHGNPGAWPKQAWSHLLQCKNVGDWVARSWSDSPPAYVQLQTQWEMYVTGLQRNDVACLIGGNQFRIYTILRDDKAIADLLTIADDFWTKVENRIAPKVDDSDACRVHFEKKFQRNAVEIAADAQVEDMFADWHELTLRQKHDKKRIETIRNQIREVMAEAGATVVRSSFGNAKLSFGAPQAPVEKTNWKHVAQLLSIKCAPGEYVELVQAATTSETPEPKAPTLYAPRQWSKES
jgi:putative phage-type endonuclease